MYFLQASRLAVYDVLHPTVQNAGGSVRAELSSLPLVLAASQDRFDWYNEPVPLCRTFFASHLLPRWAYPLHHCSFRPLKGHRPVKYFLRLLCKKMSLQRLFPLPLACQKETGIPFIEYVMEFKIVKAKRLLKDTDYSVTEIADVVG
jgi:hypothetical protein